MKRITYFYDNEPIFNLYLNYNLYGKKNPD